jgi:hypothetical protein
MAPSVIPAGKLPLRRVTDDPASEGPTTVMSDRPAPFRYLILTKFEPSRKQIGRMVERMNSLGTRRLFALKEWSVIQNASVWINHYGRQLDKAFEQWIRDSKALRDKASAKLEQLNEEFWSAIGPHIVAVSRGNSEVTETLHRYRSAPGRACQELGELAKKYRSDAPGDWDKILQFTEENGDRDHPKYRTIDGNHDSDIAEINRAAEQALIDITSGLDELGVAAVGGLPYRIARSRYYAKTFRDAQQHLRVGNIETWWSYEQFANRGMKPDLSFISSVGDRLDKLRSRLQIMKQDILQRSIAIQTEATRDNTHRLERIQNELRNLTQAVGDLAREEAEIKRDAALWRERQARAAYLIGVVGGVLGIAITIYKMIR